MLHWLGIKPLYSRHRVSDDNAFVESLFRTAKYRPEFPAKDFATLNDACHWARHFGHWYNFNHRHSGIRHVRPAQRHASDDRQILSQRHALYQQARESRPTRWSRHTRNWNPIEAVALDLERDAVISTAVQSAACKKVAAA